MGEKFFRISMKSDHLYHITFWEKNPTKLFEVNEFFADQNNFFLLCENPYSQLKFFSRIIALYMPGKWKENFHHSDCQNEFGHIISLSERSERKSQAGESSLTLLYEEWGSDYVTDLEKASKCSILEKGVERSPIFKIKNLVVWLTPHLIWNCMKKYDRDGNEARGWLRLDNA